MMMAGLVRPYMDWMDFTCTRSRYKHAAVVVVAGWLNGRRYMHGTG